MKIVTSTVFFFLAGIAALSIVYALQFAVDTSQYVVRMWSETENYMTSVERVVKYSQIEQEPGYQNQRQPTEHWPQCGKVQIKDLELVYYNGGPKILQGVPELLVALALTSLH